MFLSKNHCSVKECSSGVRPKCRQECGVIENVQKQHKESRMWNTGRTTERITGMGRRNNRRNNDNRGHSEQTFKVQTYAVNKSLSTAFSTCLQSDRTEADPHSTSAWSCLPLHQS
ncbi:hypothetical protein ILYODFUR_029664 [Ilyodon furcidens]|uniref:Uncharacterized protein n=1 Tax=Ilyodon furcidens TaxID=33524 RepID=A0ABV0T1A8_9TELE